MKLASSLLRTKLTLGLSTFSTLLPSEQAFLVEETRPDPRAGFTPEQYAMMADFYLVAPTDTAIDAINQGRHNCLAKMKDKSGNWLTSALVLTDMGDGETFEHAAPTIKGWRIVAKSLNDFPASGA